jgi:hypothetical protein
MNEFKFYVGENKVKKQRADIELAKSLINDAEERIKKVSKLDINIFSKIIFENVYDALREVIDALLAVDGYKSYSHEASIAYLKKYKIEDSTIKELDSLRYKRNSSKYYGKSISEEDAKEIIDFYQKYSEIIISVVKDKFN